MRTVLVRRENGGGACSGPVWAGWWVRRVVFSVCSSSGRAVRVVPGMAGRARPGRRRVPGCRHLRPGARGSSSWEAPGPACSAGAPVRRTKWRCSGGRPQGTPGGAPPPGPRATWGVRPCVGPSGGERALGQVDAVSRAWTRPRPSERSLGRRSPNQEHVHPTKSTFTQPRARLPEGAQPRHSRAPPQPPSPTGVTSRGHYAGFIPHPRQPPPACDGPGPTAAGPRLLCWCTRASD